MPRANHSPRVVAALVALCGLSVAAPAHAAGADASAGLPLTVQRERVRAIPLDRARLTGRTGAPQIEQRGFRIHGLPVRGAFETVSVDDEGRDLKVLRSVAPERDPQLAPKDVRVAASVAVARAIEHRKTQGSKDPGVPRSAPEMVYLMILGTPVLCWEVDMPLDLSGDEPSAPTVYVSAATGRVLHEREHVFASKAKVFPANPASTPEAIEVTLSGIDATEAGLPLVGERIVSYGCTLDIPYDEETQPGWLDEDECVPIQRAFSDDAGDFFVEVPDVRYWYVHTDGDDLYGELSMYYHAERILHTVQTEFGVVGFRCETSTMLANMRYRTIAVSYPDLDFGPLNNAYWTSKCDYDEEGPTMLFGQGSGVDYGWDGDVVYHEMGHGMVAHITPDGLWDRRLRDDATVVDASAINESVADYFSILMTDEGELGDYVAKYWDTYSRGSIRTADNEKTCPGDTVGQVHNDGEPLTAAMWATRKRVGDKLDTVFFDMLPRLSGNADLEEAAYAVLEIAKERVEAGEWTAEELEHLHRAFDARGLYDCRRVVTAPDQVSAGRSMYLRQKTGSITPFYPGPMQLRHEVPAGSDNLVVSFRLAPRSGSTGNPNTNPVGAKVLLKWADEPIRFSYSLVASTEDIVDDVEPESAKDVKEVTLVSGDWDEERVAQLVGSSDNQLVYLGLRPGDVVHISLVNTYPTEAVASSVRIESFPKGFLDQGLVPELEPEGDDTETGEPGVIVEEQGAATASCACDAGGGSRAPALLALGLLPLVRRRRARA